MASYNYENLGHERFQHLCQALLTQVFPRVTCMPIGMADGGRDAVVSNRGVDTLVFQVKFRRKTPLADATMSDMMTWLQQAIEPELPKLTKLISKGMKNYIILTNATSSSHADTGTRDKMLAWLAKRIPIEVDVWWRDDIDRRLEPLWELKRVYGLLEYPHASDSMLRAMVGGQLRAPRSKATQAANFRVTAIQKFLSSQFDRDSVIRFKEADLPRQPLLQSYLDIGADVEVQNQSFRNFLAHNSRSLRRVPGGGNARAHIGAWIDRQGHYAAAALLLQLGGNSQLKNTVIEGAPGQGKSTLVQYVCQVHRSRLLGRDAQLRGVPNEYKSSPILLPFRTDLRDLAAWLKGDNPFRSDDPKLLGYTRSVEGFIAAQVYDGSGGSTFTIDDFDEVLAETPTLLVFDGLDEVAEIEARTRVVEQITEFSARMHEVAQELRIVITSRPSAFSAAPRFPTERFAYINLANLNEPLIFDYTKTWAKTRGIDAAGTEHLLQTLREKLHESHIAELAHNSMQLAILLWLLYQQADSLPDQRTSLYEQYMKTFLDREAGKSQVIRLHRGIVITLHAYLAWVLQARAENGDSHGNMGMAEIKALAREHLQALGHSDEDLKIVDELFEQMVDRVGVLVSRVQGSYEFEVQPLREYFAALHLYETANYSPAGKEVPGTKADRFDAMVRNPYWQNVTRFYVGFFDKGELAYLVVQFDEMFKHGEYSELTYPRAVAANVLTDRIFYQSPGMGQKLAAEIVASPIGWYALSTGNGGNKFILPRDNGGSDILRVGKQLLVDDIPSYAAEVVNVMVSHCAKGELVDWWREKLPPHESPMWNTWMSIGAGLNVLPHLDTADVLQIFDPQQCDLLDYGYLFKGGLSQLALSEASVASILFDYIKAGIRPQCRAWRQDNPVDVASLVLFEFAPDAAIDASAGMIRPLTGSVPDEVANLAAFNADVAKLRTVRHQAVTNMERLILKYFGDCWLSVRFSFLHRVIPRISGPSTGELGLFRDGRDEGHSVTWTINDAVTRRGDLSWWLDQIGEIADDDEAEFMVVLLLTFGSESIISACLPLLSERIDAWSTYRLITAYDTLRWADIRRPHLNAAKMDMAGFNPSMRAFIGIRSRMDQRLRVLDDAFTAILDTRFKNQVSETIVQTIQARMTQTGRWMGSREVAVRHAGCSQLSAMMMGGIHYSPEYQRRELEDPIVQELLRNPSRYPIGLVRMADSDGSRRLAGRAVPIATTAVQDAWFDQPQPF
jgi:hypothetical protein